MREYAIYHGDTFLFVDTLENCAKRLGVKEDSVKFYATPTYYKRTNGNGYVAVRLDK